MRLEGKSLKSDFLRFIIPSIIAQWVFSLYTMVDGIFVARGVSEVALTAACSHITYDNCSYGTHKSRRDSIFQKLFIFTRFIFPIIVADQWL